MPQQWSIGSLDEMNGQLTLPYTMEEIATNEQMISAKALGPDGMPPMFYQTYWKMVRPSIIEVVLHALNIGMFPSELNHTFVALIPKRKSLELVADFRSRSSYHR